jgi:hypothetical protein
VRLCKTLYAQTFTGLICIWMDDLGNPWFGYHSLRHLTAPIALDSAILPPTTDSIFRISGKKAAQSRHPKVAADDTVGSFCFHALGAR